MVGIDSDRLLRRIEELGRCGLGASGRFRALYDDSWAEAMELVASWMREAGLQVRSDAVGNVWGRLEGAESHVAVVTGSHIDTVRGGGALDGALGVVAGIEALAALVGIGHRKSIETVAFCEEEGSRFSTQFWGSRAVVGEIAPDEAEGSTDDTGITLAGAMRLRGLDPLSVGDAARTDIETFVELHIEQGAVLHESGPRLGVVTSIAGTALLQVEMRGSADHAGTTPMSRRRDALVAAASAIQRVANAVRDFGDPAVATVGRITVEPGQSNVVPGVARFTVDVRHSVETDRTCLVEMIAEVCREAVSHADVDCNVTTLRDEKVVRADVSTSDVLRRACIAAGVEPRFMPSAALQDAQVMARRSRIGMIFVPSIGGRSHRGDEATAPEDLVLGTRALATALGLLAG